MPTQQQGFESNEPTIGNRTSFTDATDVPVEVMDNPPREPGFVGDFPPERAGRFGAATATRSEERWQRIQSEFVDDPRQSVAHAREQVSELIQCMVETLSRERSDLEQQGAETDKTTTEDLRVRLQHYRTLFSELASSMEDLEARLGEA